MNQLDFQWASVRSISQYHFLIRFQLMENGKCIRLDIILTKYWKEMFYSQEELAVEGNLVTLQSRMLWVKQFSRLWSWAAAEY